MDTKNIERKDGKLSFQVTVDPAAFEEAVNQAYLRNRKNIMIPGFRKGKAPRKLIESMYGTGVFYEDAVDAIALDCWKAGLEEAKDRTVGDPAITNYKVEDDKSMTISFECALYPEVTLGEYKGLSAYKPPVVVTDEQVDAELESVRKRNARIVAVDREAKEGDTVVIDFEGFLNGKPFEGGKGEKHSLVLGSGDFVPGFEDQLIGVKAGDERDLDITFPDNYVEDLAGKAVVFKVKVDAVQENVLPELDDDFAQDVSEFDTLDEYKASVRKDLEQKAEERSRNSLRGALLAKAAETVTVTIPDVMINTRVNAIVEDYERSVQVQGYTLDQYLGMMNMDERGFRQFIRPSAEGEIRSELMLEKICEVEGLEPTQEEIDQEYKTTAERFQMDLEHVQGMLNVEVVKHQLRMMKAGDFVVDHGIALDKPEEEEKKEEAPAPAETEAAE